MRRQTLVIFALIMPGGLSNAAWDFSPRAAATCSCNADVNNNGSVNLLDWTCIQDCKAGNCACCVNSCDINCDGVVNDADAGNDAPNEQSMWHCRFVGFPASQCCGSCCDTLAGVCSNELAAAQCAGANDEWTPALLCSEIICDPEPTGACCTTTTGACEANVIQSACSGTNLTWTGGAACSPVTCPAPPTGACCNLGNGHCHDDILEVNCTGGGMVWSASTTCSAVACSVPPQIPCPCNGEINGSAPLNMVDVLTVLDCANEVCNQCANSCDANCDGYVDYIDMGVVACRFQGLPNCCSRPSGACLNAQALPTCAITLQSGCDVLQGTYMGDGTTCSILGSVPAASSWGLIALVLLLMTAATLVIEGEKRSPALGNGP